MLRIARIILSDFFRMVPVCGPFVALRWLWHVARLLPQCRRQMNLQPADAAMGEGPFRVRLRSASAKVTGERIFSGIREIWVRDVYLNRGFVSIGPNDTVVDLGANRGNFTVLALGHGPGVRVVSVEADQAEIARFRRNVGCNGWEGRVTLVNRFIGGETDNQREIREREGSGAAGPISEREFVESNGLGSIDFLKCDIEGSEFDLFKPGSELLRRSRQIAMEIHTDIGDGEAMLKLLRDEGFELAEPRVSGFTVIVQGRKRR